MYDRALNLINEAEKTKHAKKSELYNHLMEAKPSVINRLKVLQKEIEEFQDKSKCYSVDEGGDKVGPWVYPLVSGKTPILRNDFGAYVVSNPVADNSNLAVAILLPADIDPEVAEEFREVLGKYADIRDQYVKKELSEEDSRRISQKLTKLLISAGLESSEKPLTINPAVKGSLIYMHKGSKLVAKCTRYLLDKVGDMGVSIGRSLASGAERTFGKGSAAVLGGGIVGVSTVWIALENNSRTLCRSIADQTVQSVRIKYGDEASEAAHHALFAAGHSSLAAAQLWDLGPRSIAGRMARRAGVQV
uniref:Senescence domain-containing protein n=1 Tax=Angiostrongylus cantonensis TaxID=6313 RepID=A0A158P8E0_ANGCA